MAASGSVFAKQFAGRIRQVGRDGDASRAPAAVAGAKAASAASSSTAAAAKAQIAAPPRSKAGAAASAGAAAKAKAKVAVKASAVEGEDEDDEVAGGVMTCANRDLLRQMLQNADDENPRDPPAGAAAERNDDEDEDLSMSMRLVPGTPKAGTQRRLSNVPTITSPAGSRAQQLRAVSSTSVPTINPKAVSSTSAVPTAPKVVSAASAHPWALGKAKAAVPVPKVLTGPPQVHSTAAAPIPKVLTGPPQRGPIAASQPRPGSRCGPPAAFQETMLSPTSRPKTPVSGMGTPIGERGATPLGRQNSRGSYGGIHAARAKASPSTAVAGGAAKPVLPARRPLCGPSAFDMLRERDVAQDEQAASENHEHADGVAGGIDSSNRGDSPEMDAGDRDNFEMPPDSDTDSAEGDRRDRLDEHAAPKIPASAGRDNSSVARASSGDVSAGPQSIAQESAADYVERVKRSMGVANKDSHSEELSRGTSAEIQEDVTALSQPPAAVARQGSRDMAAVVPSARARSIDARAAAATGRSVDPSSIRAQSSEPRLVVKESKTVAMESVEDSDDDDEDAGKPSSAAGLGKPGGEPWKLDVKAMVKDFAREERSRTGAGPARGPSGKAPTAPRPPKAPPNSNPSVNPAGNLRAVTETEADRPAVQSQENVPPEEQLFFSRKPREVDYVPASLDEFKQKGYGKKEIAHLGKLGPDLDDEELLMKRAVQEKKKQFSKELQKINRQRMDIAARKDAKLEPKPEAKTTARSKAQEFARNVPKPKPPQPAKPPPMDRKSKEADAAKEVEKDQADWDDIRRREKQHYDDVLRVKDIKDFLQQLPY